MVNPNFELRTLELRTRKPGQAAERHAAGKGKMKNAEAVSSHPRATPRPVDSQPIATHKPPPCDPHATLMRPSSHPGVKVECRMRMKNGRAKPPTTSRMRPATPIQAAGAGVVSAKSNSNIGRSSFPRRVLCASAWSGRWICRESPSTRPATMVALPRSCPQWSFSPTQSAAMATPKTDWAKIVSAATLTGHSRMTMNQTL